jgi:hypothetical protein
MTFPQPPTNESEAPPSYTEELAPQEREVFFAYDRNTTLHYVERLQPHHHIVEEKVLKELWGHNVVREMMEECRKGWEEEVERIERKARERERKWYEKVEELKFRVKVEMTEKELDAKFAELEGKS